MFSSGDYYKEELQQYSKVAKYSKRKSIDYIQNSELSENNK